MVDNNDISRSLIWGNRLVLVLGIWALACVSAFPGARGLLESMGAFDQGSGAILFEALTHKAIHYIALLAILAVVIKEWWLLRNFRIRFRINVIMFLAGIGFFGLFFLFHYLYVHLPSVTT